MFSSVATRSCVDKIDLSASTDGFMLITVDTQWTEADHRVTKWRVHTLEWAIIQFRDDFTGSYLLLVVAGDRRFLVFDTNQMSPATNHCPLFVRAGT